MHTQEGDARFVSTTKRETGARVGSQSENLAVAVINLKCYFQRYEAAHVDTNNPLQLPHRAAILLISRTERSNASKPPSSTARVLSSALQHLEARTSLNSRMPPPCEIFHTYDLLDQACLLPDKLSMPIRII